jgi:hypothetical protein
MRTAVLPLFSWRSGVDGRVYTSTCLAFETTMAGHLLAANLYNVQQRLHEIVTSPGASVSHESVQELYLTQTAEAYRVLCQICLENVIKAQSVLNYQALANRTQDACASALGASQPAPVLPPECDSELCIARMSMCLVRMHHHNSKRMLACVLRRTNRQGLRRESYAPQATESGPEAGAATKTSPGSGLTWTSTRLESANALDVALGAQWTLRQLTQLRHNLSRAALPSPDHFARGTGTVTGSASAASSLVAGVALNMMSAAAAKTKAAAGVPAAGGAVGKSSVTGSRACTLDACAPRLEATCTEAYLCKQYALAIFLTECNQQLDGSSSNDLVKQYAEMYGGSDARLAIFVALAALSDTELQLLQLRLVEDALAEVNRHKNTGWSFSAASLRERLWGSRTRTNNASDMPSEASLTGEEEMPAEEQIEEERARGMAEAYDSAGLDEETPSRRLDARDRAERDRDRLGVRSEHLNRSTPLESTLVGLLKERCELMKERLAGALGFMVLNSGELVDAEGLKRLRRIIRGMSALFADNENAVTAQFYGYHTHSLKHFAAALSKPYLQELLSYYSPLGFAC